MNAKEEFIEHIKDRVVLCASLRTEEGYFEPIPTFYLLKMDFTKIDFGLFLSSINFEYDEGYGHKTLFGTIWYTDGTYSERGEYDGSEWWEHKETPIIPDQLKETK